MTAAMPTPLPRAMLIDLDDTILSAFGPSEGQWHRVAADFAPHFAPLPPSQVVRAILAQSRVLWGDPSRHKDWRQRIEEARRHIVAAAFAELAAAGHREMPRALCDAIAEAFQQLHDAEMSLFPGAHDALDRLKELGVKLALITNGAAAPQRAKIVRFALEHRFDHIQIEGEHGFGKPEERAYRHAMAALGVGPRDTWMVGDNLEWEVAAPQRLGIYSIWIDSYERGLPADSPVRPDRIIRSLVELLP